MTLNNEQEALNRAINYANDFTIGIAGVTKENMVVINEECVRYRERINDLKFEVNGNWGIERNSKRSRWKQRASATIVEYR
ncbi:MAG TPA: hypothetical protein VIM65_02245 [Cyclobacteriaceae bacterium]